MGDEKVSQDEEEEALLAIYDGDPAFKQISSTVFQYKCGEDGDPKSILIEISWPATYPTEMPLINLDTFYNKHLEQGVKEFVRTKLLEKAEQYLGEAVTYTLIELVKDNLDSWSLEFDRFTSTKPVTQLEKTIEELPGLRIDDTATKKEPKKEQLTKAQKRRQWNRCDARGEKPRGWNWVDVVKHLSQTGSHGGECDLYSN